MDNTRLIGRIGKFILVLISLTVASQVLVGCNTDEKPSKMVEMRQQMQQQRQAMGGRAGGTAPGAPAGQGVPAPAKSGQ
ncbi:MAG: hypothetical protein P4L46_12845 [Fimbriimonas sp.]|nr:hypothetical protein [Fimbriimonas sp.]